MSDNSVIKKILVIRNDKIGDFMLVWPAVSLLKRQYPDAEITALVPAYTAALAEQCEWIDKVLIDTKKSSFFRDIAALSKKISDAKFDISISFFSQGRTAIALYLAGVKKRIGPATKLAQLFLNTSLRQKRSESTKPEYEYNTDLIRFLISDNKDIAVSPAETPYMSFNPDTLTAIKATLIKHGNISDDTKLIFIHPGSGGSAVNLSLQQYANLVRKIAKKCRVFFIITAGPDELAYAEELSALLQDVDHSIHHSCNGIIEFCKFIAICDVFISGSTGPLHIAGALNVCTAAFYPARQSATALRWQTLNSKDRRLAFSPDKYTGEHDMLSIDTSRAATSIIDSFLDRTGKASISSPASIKTD